MKRSLIECVPNFSEGRDRSKIESIAAAIASTPGALILDVSSDPDHHRSVITYAVPAASAVEAAVAAAARAMDLIDLNQHHGVHPRIGALDVLPFVPLEGSTLEQCASLAAEAAEAIWNRLGLPCYLYEAAARRPDRINLADIRRGGFEALRADVQNQPARRPDVGGPSLHPTAGAAVVGARKFLIAYNVQLDTPEVEVARQIARRIRASDGGLPCVKALGLFLPARGVAQVSMNLTDFERTPIHRVFEAVCAEAAALGVAVLDSELVGLIPRGAIEQTAGSALRFPAFRSSQVVENRIAELTPGGFDLCLEALEQDDEAGGARAAAALGAMAAALGAGFARSAGLDASPLQADRRFFSTAAESGAPPQIIAARAAQMESRLIQLQATCGGSRLETALAACAACRASAAKAATLS